MHKISKEKHEYTIITWKKAHQHPLDELAAHGVCGNHFCHREIHPKTLICYLIFWFLSYCLFKCMQDDKR
jgi:hypothetical protein